MKTRIFATYAAVSVLFMGACGGRIVETAPEGPEQFVPISITVTSGNGPGMPGVGKDSYDWADTRGDEGDVGSMPDSVVSKCDISFGTIELTRLNQATDGGIEIRDVTGGNLADECLDPNRCIACKREFKYLNDAGGWVVDALQKRCVGTCEGIVPINISDEFKFVSHFYATAETEAPSVIKAALVQTGFIENFDEIAEWADRAQLISGAVHDSAPEGDYNMYFDPLQDPFLDNALPTRDLLNIAPGDPDYDPNDIRAWVKAFTPAIYDEVPPHEAPFSGRLHTYLVGEIPFTGEENDLSRGPITVITQWCSDVDTCYEVTDMALNFDMSLYGRYMDAENAYFSDEATDVNAAVVYVRATPDDGGTFLDFVESSIKKSNVVLEAVLLKDSEERSQPAMDRVVDYEPEDLRQIVVTPVDAWKYQKQAMTLLLDDLEIIEGGRVLGQSAIETVEFDAACALSDDFAQDLLAECYDEVDAQGGITVSVVRDYSGAGVDSRMVFSPPLTLEEEGFGVGKAIVLEYDGAFVAGRVRMDGVPFDNADGFAFYIIGKTNDSWGFINFRVTNHNFDILGEGDWRPACTTERFLDSAIPKYTHGAAMDCTELMGDWIEFRIGPVVEFEGQSYMDVYVNDKRIDLFGEPVFPDLETRMPVLPGFYDLEAGFSVSFREETDMTSISLDSIEMRGYAGRDPGGMGIYVTTDTTGYIRQGLDLPPEPLTFDLIEDAVLIGVFTGAGNPIAPDAVDVKIDQGVGAAFDDNISPLDFDHMTELNIYIYSENIQGGKFLEGGVISPAEFVTGVIPGGPLEGKRFAMVTPERPYVYQKLALEFRIMGQVMENGRQQWPPKYFHPFSSACATSDEFNNTDALTGCFSDADISRAGDVYAPTMTLAQAEAAGFLVHDPAVGWTHKIDVNDTGDEGDIVVLSKNGITNVNQNFEGEFRFKSFANVVDSAGVVDGEGSRDAVYARVIGNIGFAVAGIEGEDNAGVRKTWCVAKKYLWNDVDAYERVGGVKADCTAMGGAPLNLRLKSIADGDLLLKAHYATGENWIEITDPYDGVDVGDMTMQNLGGLGDVPSFSIIVTSSSAANTLGEEMQVEIDGAYLRGIYIDGYMDESPNGSVGYAPTQPPGGVN